MKNKFIPYGSIVSYYPLLFMALETTKGDVVEMGCGHGSTTLLREYCKKRNLFSYEEKQEWADKFPTQKKNHHLILVTDWDCVKNNHQNTANVIFIDHAPGERRKEDILNFQNTKGIIVCHDTEPAADAGYQMRQHFSKFKFVVEVKTNGAWATALSNEIDITKWIGEKFGEYTISKY